MAKQKNILIKDMLSDCSLSINTLSQVTDKKGLASMSLSKIADYLGCSVDYLLGRTNDADVQNEIELAPEEYPVIVKYRAIGERGQAVVDQLLDELHAKKDAPTAYSDERIEAILQSSYEMQQLSKVLNQLPKEKLLEVIRFVQFQKSLNDSAGE